jgi:hypothetical protein
MAFYILVKLPALGNKHKAKGRLWEPWQRTMDTVAGQDAVYTRVTAADGSEHYKRTEAVSVHCTLATWHVIDAWCAFSPGVKMKLRDRKMGERWHEPTCTCLNECWYIEFTYAGACKLFGTERAERFMKHGSDCTRCRKPVGDSVEEEVDDDDDSHTSDDASTNEQLRQDELAMVSSDAREETPGETETPAETSEDDAGDESLGETGEKTQLDYDKERRELSVRMAELDAEEREAKLRVEAAGSESEKCGSDGTPRKRRKK